MMRQPVFAGDRGRCLRNCHGTTTASQVMADHVRRPGPARRGGPASRVSRRLGGQGLPGWPKACIHASCRGRPSGRGRAPRGNGAEHRRYRRTRLAAGSADGEQEGELPADLAAAYVTDHGTRAGTDAGQASDLAIHPAPTRVPAPRSGLSDPPRPRGAGGQYTAALPGRGSAGSRRRR